MEAKELVGKWIESKVLSDKLNTPANEAFKVVGYRTDVNWPIIDAGRWGWKGLEPDDIIIEKCETYWLVYPGNITKVL